MGVSVVSDEVVVVGVVVVSAEVSVLSSSERQAIIVIARTRASARIINDLKVFFMIISPLISYS